MHPDQDVFVGQRSGRAGRQQMRPRVRESRVGGTRATARGPARYDHPILFISHRIAPVSHDRYTYRGEAVGLPFQRGRVGEVGLDGNLGSGTIAGP